MKHFILLGLLSLTTMMISSGASTAENSKNVPQRIVFLGDSITDGNTYPLMIQEAIRAAGAPAPEVINAGIGGDTADGMSRRIERDVLVHKPKLVTLSAGINDAIRKVSLEEYSRSVTAVADKLREAKVDLMILTTSVYGPKHAEAERRTDEYNAWLKTFAKERGLKIAEVNAEFKKARTDKGDDFFMEPDAVHPNWEGQRIMARAVLDVLGFQNAKVPQQLALKALPGVLSPWRIALAVQPTSDDAARLLSQQILANPAEFQSWREYSLPESKPQEHQWYEQERQRGFALSLDKELGASKLYNGYIILNNKSNTPKPVAFTTGAQLQGVWLNGERVYKHDEWRGWHAGREVVAATLQPGKNVVLIEAGSQFFLSVTDR